MIPTEKLHEIIAVAENATPGDWAFGPPDGDGPHGMADARLIATADPTTVADMARELLTLREQRKALTDYISAEDTGALLNEVVVLREQRDKVLALCDQWSDENRDGSFFSQFTRGIVAHVRRALGVTPEADQ